MSSNKSEDSNQELNIQKLNEMNAQLDAELKKYKQLMSNSNNNSNSNSKIRNNNSNNDSYNGNNSNMNNYQYPKFTQSTSYSTLNNENNSNSNNSSRNTNNLQYNDYYNNNNKNNSNSFPKLASLEPNFLETKLNFVDNEDTNTPICIRREGMLKIRDADQKDKNVVVTYAVLTKTRLSYFVNAKDESSIQGSIELDKIKESLKLINGFSSCFTVKTLDSVSDCSICAESEDSAREWINSITQNAVNCNTLSALNSLNKRGMLK